MTFIIIPLHFIVVYALEIIYIHASVRQKHYLTTACCWQGVPPDLQVGSFQAAVVGVFTPRELAHPPHQGFFPADSRLFEDLRRRDQVRQWLHAEQTQEVLGAHSRLSCSQAFLP